MITSTGFMRIKSLLSFAEAITIIFSSTMLNGQVSYSVDFSTSMVIFDKISTEDGNIYDKVEYTTLSRLDELGKPLLPVKYIKLIVPSDQDVDSIVLRHIKKEEMPGSFFVLPVQRPIPTSIDPPKQPFIKPDPEVYDSDTPYPKEIAAVSNDGFFDGLNHIITVAIYPIQYLPKSGRLTFHSLIDFEIKMKPSDKVRMYKGMRTPENQGIYNAILNKIVDNPQDIPIYQRKASLGKSESVQINPLPSYEYVIITNNSLKNYLNPFISWKRRKGLNIGIVTMEEINANYTTDLISGIIDQAGALRQYLSDSYPTTMWALLVGDHTIVPVRYGAGFTNCSWLYYSEDKIPADLYYSDFNGDWDVDSETPKRYGEPSGTYGDSPDYNPEIFVGRVSSTNSTDVNNWIYRILKYELNPGSGKDAYLQKAFWVSADQMIDQPDLVSSWYPSSFSGNHEMYKANHPGNEVVQEMSNKYGLLNWYCHGNVNSFSVYSIDPSRRFVWTTDNSSYYNVSDNLVTSGISGDGLDNMTNLDFPSAVYSICCLTCAFDDFCTTSRPDTIPGLLNTYPIGQRSMAEGFNVVKNQLVNGPIKLGNTRNGWVDYSYLLHQQFCNLWRNGTTDTESGQTSYHVGVAEAISKLNYTSGMNHYLRYSHNLFGCPETNLWTDSLASFTNVSITDNGTSIAVNANVNGCDICASSSNNGTSYFLVQKNVSSYTFSTAIRPLYITITKHNYVPYTAVTGGAFSSNEYWFGDLYVRGDITIGSGYTLTVMKGSKITFSTTDDRSGGVDATKCELIVNGTLDADSTTFIGPTKGSWYGIRYMSSSTNGHLINCTIKNANYAVFIYDKSPYIYHNFIDDAASCGIYIQGSTAQPLISHNYIEADYACVAHYSGGNGYFNNNSFRNAKYGIYISSGSPSYDYYNTGRNKFETSVYKDKVQVYSGQPIFSQYQYFTKPTSGYYYIRNNTANTILARYDYWIDHPPSSSYFYGNVDRSNDLASPPSNPPAGPGWTLPKASGDDFYIEFDRSRKLFYDERYPEARSQFKKLTEKFFNLEYSSYSLNWYMLATEQIGDISGQVDYLNSIKKDKLYHTNTRFYALKWLLQYEMRKGTIEKAKKLADETESGTLYDREISLDLAMGLFELKNDKQGAEAVLSKLLEKFKDENTIEVVGFIKKNFIKDVEPNKPTEEMLDVSGDGLSVGVFPNPSNGSVKILYGLAHSGYISAVIYNMIGQKVLTLIDKYMEAGKHETVWDGKDASGQVVPSGMYLCRFEATGKPKTMKLLMIK